MDTKPQWGFYAPPVASWPLRALISSGLARGKLRKKILREWKQRFGAIVDVKIAGIKFRLNLDDNVTDGRILTSFSRYDRSEIELLKTACKGGVFVDIGANIGLYTLVLSAAGAKAIAVEPNPKSLARLNFNCSLNDFANETSILPIGIGEKGEFELVSSGDLGGAHMRPNHCGHTESVTITTKPLLEVLNEQKIDKLGGIKIDIEGMEDRALIPFFESAPESLWPRCIVIEHCNRNFWNDDVIEYMLKINYAAICTTRSNTVLIRD